MGVKSKGRGAAATFGLLVLLAGVAGAAALWLMADRRPEEAVERFARGPVGCTTTLEFGDTGTFYVYEEVTGATSDAFDECSPSATPGTEFAFELLADGRPVAARTDASITYDTPDAIGVSLARIEIAEPGRYQLVVEGSDPTVVAAIGRDPELGVDELRRGSIIVGVLGVLLGALLLLLAGRRSKRAATVTTPSGPGWGSAAPPAQPVPAWPPAPPRVPEVAVDPQRPPEVVTAHASDGDSADEPPDASSAPQPWAPPRPSERLDPPTS